MKPSTTTTTTTTNAISMMLDEGDSSVEILSTTMNLPLVVSTPSRRKRRGRPSSFDANSSDAIVAAMDYQSRKIRERESISRIHRFKGPLPTLALFPELEHDHHEQGSLLDSSSYSAGGDDSDDGEAPSFSFLPKLKPMKRRRAVLHEEDQQPTSPLFY